MHKSLVPLLAAAVLVGQAAIAGEKSCPVAQAASGAATHHAEHQPAAAAGGAGPGCPVVQEAVKNREQPLRSRVEVQASPRDDKTAVEKGQKAEASRK